MPLPWLLVFVFFVLFFFVLFSYLNYSFLHSNFSSSISKISSKNFSFCW